MAAKALLKMDDMKSFELLQLVSFTLGGEEYGVEALKVREIIRVPSITRVPNVARGVEGIINLRGKVIPIISMRKRFGLSESESGAGTRIVIMDVASGQAGFIVDGVSEVIRISGSEIQPPPAMVLSGGGNQEFVTGILNSEARLMIIMDVDRLLSEEERDSLGRIEG